MGDENVRLIQSAFAEYLQGNLSAILDLVDPEFEWTYLEPSLANPEPQVCHGRQEFQRALQRQLHAGFTVELEEVQGHGEHVVVIVHLPGLDHHRVRQANDRNYEVFTIQQGRITALRACHDRDEALRVASLVP